MNTEQFLKIQLKIPQDRSFHRGDCDLQSYEVIEIMNNWAKFVIEREVTNGTLSVTYKDLKDIKESIK